MSGLPTAAFRAVAQDDAIPDGFVVPFYLNDRKRTDDPLAPGLLRVALASSETGEGTQVRP
jgi:hypothetical protein